MDQRLIRMFITRLGEMILYGLEVIVNQGKDLVPLLRAKQIGTAWRVAIAISRQNFVLNTMETGGNT